MHFHNIHPHQFHRSTKPIDLTLDTSTESEDSHLLTHPSIYPSFHHPQACKIKHSLCRNFTEQGFCPYGDRCQFAHGPQELRNNRVNNQSYKTRLCLRFIRNGFCIYGQRCNFIHPHLFSHTDAPKQKWRIIYSNFRDSMDMFEKGRKGGERLMALLGIAQTPL